MSLADFLEYISDFLIPILIILALFLLFRWINLWYWKIDKIVSLLEEIRDNFVIIQKKIQKIQKKEED